MTSKEYDMFLRLKVTSITGATLIGISSLMGCGTEEAGDGGLVTDAQIRVNEYMSVNSAPVTPTDVDIQDPDEAGTHPDWLELYNTETTDISLDGWYITDDDQDIYKHRLSASAVVPAQGFLVLWADGDSTQGPNVHLRFKLAGAGGEILVLSNPSGEQIERVTMNPGAAGTSWARRPDGTGEFTSGPPTVGATNGAL